MRAGADFLAERIFDQRPGAGLILQLQRCFGMGGGEAGSPLGREAVNGGPAFCKSWTVLMPTCALSPYRTGRWRHVADLIIGMDAR